MNNSILHRSIRRIAALLARSLPNAAWERPVDRKSVSDGGGVCWRAPRVRSLPIALQLFSAFASVLAVAAPPEPRFESVTLDPAVQIGYCVDIADVDGD